MILLSLRMISCCNLREVVKQCLGTNILYFRLQHFKTQQFFIIFPPFSSNLSQGNRAEAHFVNSLVLYFREFSRVKLLSLHRDEYRHYGILSARLSLINCLFSFLYILIVFFCRNLLVSLPSDF